MCRGIRNVYKKEHLCCVYGDVLGTWEAQSDMWKAVSKATAASGKPFIWGGDWNSCPAEAHEILGSMNIPGKVVAPSRSTCVSPGGGSVIDYFITHRGLEGWCQEATVFKEGYSAPHRPVEMLIKGQQVQGKVSVHKRPPALREPMVHGPSDTLTAGLRPRVTRSLLLRMNSILQLTGRTKPKS